MTAPIESSAPAETPSEATPSEATPSEATPDAPERASVRDRIYLASLATSVGAVAVCGIVYQLVIGTVSTYLAGNSTLQFSLTIGLFMSAYGLGSFASTLVHKRLLEAFVATELLIGVVGGISSALLFWLYAETESFGLGRAALIMVLGTLVGLEIPLLIRITERYRRNLRLTVGQMMGFDYIGALLGGIGFPLLLLPAFGLVGSALWIGVFNCVVGGALVAIFWRELRYRQAFAGLSAIAGVVLLVGALDARTLERQLEQSLYEDPIVLLEQSPYQKLVLTRRGGDVRLFLDGALQFASIDEHRYHESLVHPAASRLARLDHVLILGGGDGMALRELWRHGERVGEVTLVDLDPAVVRIARTHELLREMNGASLDDPRVTVVHDDAFTWVNEHAAELRGEIDLIVVDLPDPRHESLAKLYSVAFYRQLGTLLDTDGLAVLQLASPFFARRTFWASVATLREAGLDVAPFHVNVPTFGEWGFALAGRSVRAAPRPELEVVGKFYDTAHDAPLFWFPADLRLGADEVEPNTLMRPVIVQYFLDDWASWN